jgi:hypothetical protein
MTSQTQSERSDLRLVALLPMQSGYGPADHDAYEARISPIAATHGMARSAAFTVVQFLGGAGPQHAATLGVWSLETANTLEAVMSDPRYLNEVPTRDRVHDMARAAMFVAHEEPAPSAYTQGHALLAGVLVMKPDYGFDEHIAYERAIEPVSARHGMRLVRSFRVLSTMGALSGNVVAVSLWDMPRPEALQAIMSDPDYVAQIAYRDRIHNMAATSLYFVTPRL